MGWYNGLGGRHMMSEKGLKGVVQDPPYNFDQDLRMVECNWQSSYTNHQFLKLQNKIDEVAPISFIRDK